MIPSLRNAVRFVALGFGLLGFTSPALRAADFDLHVSPRGLDSWSGTTSRPDPARHQGPFATVQAAVAKSREIHATNPSATVTIHLAAGRHELASPLQLGASDSRTVFAGNRRGQPSVLSGGSRITGWKPVPAKPGTWEAPVPGAVDGHVTFNQLFLNGTRLQRARTPNSGFFQTAGPLSKDAPIRLPFKAGDIPSGWASDPDARVVLLMKWTDLHLPVRAVDPQRHVATLAGGPRADWMDEPDARYWLENSADALDAPGEWHLDRRAGSVRMIPPAGFKPDRDLVVAPQLTQLVRIEGKPGFPAEGIAFRDLTFAEADYTMPAEGMISPQAAVVIPGTFVARWAVDCRIEQCRFTAMGGYGIELGRGAQRCTVQSCDLEGLGAGGLRIGEPGDRNPAPADANHSHLIADNRLVGLGRIFAPAVGVLVFHSGTNRIVHNHIADLYYTGISVGWNWGYNDTPCRANEIAWNLVERIGQGRLSDMGGIYTLGPQPGTHIHHNLFRDIESYRYGGWGLYTDEGSTGILLENNVVYRCKDAGFHQHYGRDNVVRNNLLAFNRNHQVMRTRAEAHRSFWFTNNVVIHDQGTLLGSNWDGDTHRFWMDRNLYWDTRLGADTARYRLGKKSWAEWRAAGQDPSSRIADPLLRDPARPELGLKRGSPAFELGFEPIDLKDVGPRR